MSVLIEKMRAARQRDIEINDHHYTIRRPTPMEAMEWLSSADNTKPTWMAEPFSLKSKGWRDAAWYAVNHFVDGWDVKEIDLIPGGVSVPVPFSVELLGEWLLDRPDVLSQLTIRILDLWIDYNNQQVDDEKKPETGLEPIAEPNSAITN